MCVCVYIYIYICVCMYGAQGRIQALPAQLEMDVSLVCLVCFNYVRALELFESNYLKGPI